MENEVRVAVVPQNTIDKIFGELADMKEIINRIADGQFQPVAVDELREPEKDQDELIDSKEAATILGVSTRTVQNYREAGTLTYYQMGGAIRFRRSDIRDFLSKHKVNARRERHGRD